MSEKRQILVWPDYSWEFVDEIEDLDWHLAESGKSDDYKEYNVPAELDFEDIEELIELRALEGMIPPKQDASELGVIKLDDSDILVIDLPKDIDSMDITTVPGKIIINSHDVSFHVLKGK